MHGVEPHILLLRGQGLDKFGGGALADDVGGRDEWVAREVGDLSGAADEDAFVRQSGVRGCWLLVKEGVCKVVQAADVDVELCEECGCWQIADEAFRASTASGVEENVDCRERLELWKVSDEVVWEDAPKIVNIPVLTPRHCRLYRLCGSLCLCLCTET